MKIKDEVHEGTMNYYLIEGSKPDKRMSNGTRSHSIVIQLPEYQVTKSNLDRRFPWWKSVQKLTPVLQKRHEL